MPHLDTEVKDNNLLFYDFNNFSTSGDVTTLQQSINTAIRDVRSSQGRQRNGFEQISSQRSTALST